MPRRIYVFGAALVDVRGVRRTIAVRDDQTLDDLHHALRDAFGWDDDHLYSFWLDGRFWSRSGPEYTHPWHAEAPAKPASVALARIGLDQGQKLAYVFDFGDEWRVRLTLRRLVDDDGGTYPRLLQAVGEAPPQYPDYEDEEFEDVA
jgi:hypothetical protein